MIIKKQDFKNQDDWPFLVDEVEVEIVKWHVECFAIKYKWKKYALSGMLVGHGYFPLEEAAIWSGNPEIPGTKKSLTPVFEYLKNLK